MTDMAQHTHVTQGARLPADCPACAAVWGGLSELYPYVDLDEEFQVTRTLFDDYGESEMVSHLTQAMKRSQTFKYQLG